MCGVIMSIFNDNDIEVSNYFILKIAFDSITDYFHFENNRFLTNTYSFDA